MLSNIPGELQALPQWVCWRLEVVNGRMTKVPYRPNGQGKASHSDPATWGTFVQAWDTAYRQGMSGIGLVLTANDPYTGIDIDDKEDNPATEEQYQRQQKILSFFESYAERSPGARWIDPQGRERGGYHIIIRGQIPQGVDRDHIGVYSCSRYLAFTGDVIRNAPIADYQSLLDVLYGEMQPAPLIGLEQVDGLLDDGSLVDMAMNAANADKFNALCAGNWQQDYTSQSEADLALLSILCFYTPDNEQVRRIFRMTALGKRDKAICNDKYLNFSLTRVRRNEPPPVDFSQLAINMQAIAQPPAPEPIPLQVIAQPAQPMPQLAIDIQEAESAAALPTPSDAALVTPPGGLIGEIASYFYSSSVRPIPEACIISAIGLVAGICGRSYNISNTGLNQYLLFLAETGSGKEAIRQGPQRIINALISQVPIAGQFLGPKIASGQALYKHLPTSPVFVCIMGEFGDVLQRLNDPRANMAEKTTKIALLELYNSSGWGDCVPATVYSDREKNTEMIRAPSVSILGEGTADKFYEGLDLSQVSDGLIPRFMVVEFSGDRPNYQEVSHAAPPDDLLHKVRKLIEVAMTTSANNTCCQVQQDAEAAKILRAYNRSLDAAHNKAKLHNDPLRNLWNRAHLKALKLAALLAVGNNPHNPIISKVEADWAIAYVEASIAQVAGRFQQGDGNGNDPYLKALCWHPG